MRSRTAVVMFHTHGHQREVDQRTNAMIHRVTSQRGRGKKSGDIQFTATEMNRLYHDPRSILNPTSPEKIVTLRNTNDQGSLLVGEHTTYETWILAQRRVVGKIAYARIFCAMLCSLLTPVHFIKMLHVSYCVQMKPSLLNDFAVALPIRTYTTVHLVLILRRAV